MPDAALLAELLDGQVRVLAELAAIRAIVERGRSAHVQDPAAGELVRCIAALPSGTEFTVAELLEHAEVSPPMRAAIVKSVGALNGRKIGKLLRRIEGIDFEGASIVQCGRNREGVSWLCEFREFETRKAVAGR